MSAILIGEAAVAAVILEQRRRRASQVGRFDAYRNAPIDWAKDVLHVRSETLLWSLDPSYTLHTWDGDADPLAALLNGVAQSLDVGLEAGTGIGKSFGAAVLVLWFLACWENAQVYTFAPKADQLKLFIWRHIAEFMPAFRAAFPSAELTDLTLRVRGGTDETWAAHGYPVGVRAGEPISTHAAGMHAEHMLLVYEECTGIPPAVLAAGENTCTAPHNLRVGIGNPNHQLDPLHQFCLSPGVLHVRASALDHPNVVRSDAGLITGAVSRLSIDRRRIKYGDASPVYQSRVRGISPEQASDALIRLEWLRASAERFNTRMSRGEFLPPITLTGKGVDVANSEHGDRAAICDIVGAAVVRLEAFACPDANALGRKVALELTAANLSASLCGCDTIGVGAGTFNELHRLGHRIQGINAGAKPLLRTERAPEGGTYEWAADGNVFRTFRDQLWWQLREDFRLNRLDCPQDAELWEELTCPTFVDEPKTIVEAKDEMKARLGRSPDKADALIIANWVRRRRGLLYVEQPVEAIAGHDPAIRFRTVDGGPPRWVGPENDQGADWQRGYADQLPSGI